MCESLSAFAEFYHHLHRQHPHPHNHRRHPLNRIIIRLVAVAVVLLGVRAGGLGVVLLVLALRRGRLLHPAPLMQSECCTGSLEGLLRVSF